MEFVVKRDKWRRGGDPADTYLLSKRTGEILCVREIFHPGEHGAAHLVVDDPTRGRICVNCDGAWLGLKEGEFCWSPGWNARNQDGASS